MGHEWEYDLKRIGPKSFDLAGSGVHILRCDLTLTKGYVLGEMSHRGKSSAGPPGLWIPRSVDVIQDRR